MAGTALQPTAAHLEEGLRALGRRKALGAGGVDADPCSDLWWTCGGTVSPSASLRTPEAVLQGQRVSHPPDS